MSSINKIMIIGNLGHDPEVRYLESGTCITTISVATTERRKDKNGEAIEKTEWHRVKLWGKLGEIAGEYLSKGAKVYIEGRMEYGEYEGRDGNKRHTAEIIASEMRMLGGGNREGGERRERPQRSGPPTTRPTRGQSGEDYRGAKEGRAPAPRNDETFPDDDIPF